MGILHFHERDLARCLLYFHRPESGEQSYRDVRDLVLEATAYHHHSFTSRAEAASWAGDHYDRILTCAEKTIWCNEVVKLAKAKTPFNLYRISLW